MSNILFEVTEKNLETGLRGVPVGYCITSSVDPEKGLFYMGQPVSKLAYKEPIEVIYLLYHGKEGSLEEVEAFKKDLEKRANLKEETIASIRNLSRKGHPMKLFSAALLIVGMLEGTGDYREDCLNVIAKIPQIAAVVINYHAGWDQVKPSNPQLGYMENFAQMLNVPNADVSVLTHVFKLFDVLHYDHGGGNLSAFVGKAIASGLEDMYGSLSGAMCALAGPRHGKANQDCLDFVKQVEKELGENITEEALENLIRDKLSKKELIYGFGHAVLRVEDPRATILYEVAQKQFPEHNLVKIAMMLRKVGSKVLKENPKIADPYPNVDAISGTVLTAAGFPYSEYYTILFGMSRCVGIARQIVYERLEARNGRGLPIMRPKYLFKKVN